MFLSNLTIKGKCVPSLSVFTGRNLSDNPFVTLSGVYSSKCSCNGLGNYGATPQK